MPFEFVERPVLKNTVFRGKIVNVRQDTAALHTGKEVSREIVEHPGGVVILPLDGDNNVICVRQFRYAFSSELLELPAGKLEPGENPESAALRELKEEIGCVPGVFTPLGRIYPSPGYCTEILYLYLARELEEGAPTPDDDEYLTLERVPYTELCRRVLRGDIPDAKTAAAVLMAQPLILGER
ncbi:NUDIX hydrolase [Oscillospiraceae bacterium OttesenSCG-928-F05]|nr:NUDIX hydrolase [Oscillospiraceae bacterium OttesenSCG-928-F05]